MVVFLEALVVTVRAHVVVLPVRCILPVTLIIAPLGVVMVYQVVLIVVGLGSPVLMVGLSVLFVKWLESGESALAVSLFVRLSCLRAMVVVFRVSGVGNHRVLLPLVTLLGPWLRSESVVEATHPVWDFVRV